VAPGLAGALPTVVLAREGRAGGAGSPGEAIGT